MKKIIRNDFKCESCAKKFDGKTLECLHCALCFARNNGIDESCLYLQDEIKIKIESEVRR